MSLTFRTIQDPHDPQLPIFSQLMHATLADPNIVLGLDRMQEFIQKRDQEEGRRFFVGIVERDGRVIGGAVFNYSIRSNCGFSEYIVVARNYRGQGVGKLIFNERRRLLDEEARLWGHARCHGLFIEVENPDRTPPQFLEAEQETALDAWDRWRLFHRWGFQVVDVPYVQPPLAPGKHPVDYMDLLFVPWEDRARAQGRIPASWIIDTVEPIWRSWAPEEHRPHLEALIRHIEAKGPSVAIRPLFSESA